MELRMNIIMNIISMRGPETHNYNLLNLLLSAWTTCYVVYQAKPTALKK